MTRKGSDRMLATNEEMQRMDQRAVEEGHVSMVQLMKQAADALFEALCRRYGRKCRYGIFCGSGNNGGDGYALALRMKAERIHQHIRCFDRLCISGKLQHLLSAFFQQLSIMPGTGGAWLPQ